MDEMPGKHRRVECDHYNHEMRKDNMKRHMNAHRNDPPVLLSEDDIRNEIKSRRELELSCEAKRQRLEHTALVEGVAIPNEIASSKIAEYTEKFGERMLREQNNYFKKLELGQKVSEILERKEAFNQSLKKKKEIFEQSLQKDFKKALELYMENRC